MLKRLITAVLIVVAGVSLSATAKGPKPSPDIIVEASISPSEWMVGAWVGNFLASGIIEDSGEVYLMDSMFEPDGSLWQVYEFVGAFGAFQSVLPVRPLPDHRDTCLFEILGSGGAYVNLYAFGTARGRTRKMCYWVREDPTYPGKECIYTVNWTLDAFVP